MSDLDKKYTIRLDLINNIQNEKMRFSLSDNETSDFYINITKSTKKVDLTYKTVKLYVVKPNKNVIYTTVTPYTEFNDTNVFYCDLPNDFKNIKGTYYAQMLVEDMITGEKVVAPSKFSYIVESDIMSEMYEVADTEENKNILDSILSDLTDLKANRVTINDTTPGSTTTYSSSKIENIKEDLSSQISAIGGSGGTIPDNVVLFEETTETPIIQETSIPINSQNGTTYYIKVDDDGALSVQNTDGETVWSGGGGQDVVAATSLTLDKTSKTIMVSETFTLTPTIEPVDCTQTLKWYTNNATIATVDNGVVTGQGIGNCTITAKVGNCTATCDVTVQKFVLLIWNSGPVNDNITGGWDYTTDNNYSYLDENGNYVLTGSNAGWNFKHFVTRNAIDLSKYSKLILTLEVDGSGECKCETSDDGTSVTSTYKYLKVNSSTTEYTVDISGLTNTTRLSFNNYGTQVIIKKIGLE